MQPRWVCNENYRQKWSKISVKAKNRKRRLQARVKAYEEMIKGAPVLAQTALRRAFRKPGSLKK